MHDPRLAPRLMKHWDKIRKSCRLPRIQNLSVDSIEDIWSQCALLSVHANNNQPIYRYEYMSPTLVEAYGRDLTGMYVDDRMRQIPGSSIIRRFRKILEHQKPDEDKGYFVSESGRLIKYKACYLPFGQEGKGTSHIVVGLSFRVF